MRSFIILLKKIGLQKLFAIIIAAVLIGIAFTYLAKTPKDSTKGVSDTSGSNKIPSFDS